MRDGVEECIRIFADGFLGHPSNESLRNEIGSGRLTAAALYKQFLKLVYRLIFLLVAEDRGLVSSDAVYREHYGIGRLRRFLEIRSSFSDHTDLWMGLRVLWRILGDERLASLLFLAPLNGELFAPVDLDGYLISNEDLLEAFWRLANYRESPSSPVRRVNYSALDVEELGSVYESLLEFHPVVETDGAGRPQFRLASGSERKTTGSYYTPPELVNELIHSALVPVLNKHLEAGASAAEKERAILGIRVCDPACGSGHFLLAAARRLGKELARTRTGEDEPAPERLRECIRDIIAHCIYGVDKNPLAVDLCRVALWIEGHTEGKPLTFLDHRILCGDSLVGVFDLAALKDGIPDEAFKPFEGDDKEAARAALRQNRFEKSEQPKLFGWDPILGLGEFCLHCREVEAIADDSPEHIRQKKAAFEAQHRNRAWLRDKTACDLWTAAFFQKHVTEQPPITTGAIAEVLGGGSIEGRLMGQAGALAQSQAFFHWPLEFPEVFAQGGFDIVLSNPPWERVKVQELEFFAVRDAHIANAPNKAARTRLIRELPDTNPELYSEFMAALRAAAGTSNILRYGGRFPLTGQGDVNTYAVFAELCRDAIHSGGRAGIIVPSGIATDNTTRDFFGDLISKQELVSFFEFENEGFFPGAGQGHMLRFAPTTMLGTGTKVEAARFLFQGKSLADLKDEDRVFTLSSSDIALVNPNTRTCPIFRSLRDAEITRAIYRRVPVLILEGLLERNSWGIHFMRMFDMTNDSYLFKTKFALEQDGYRLEGNCFHKGGKCYVPLYESKMVYQYNHRHGDFLDSGDGERAHVLPSVSADRLRDVSYLALPYYWVPEAEIKQLLDAKSWNFAWLIGWRNVTDARASARTLVASVIPRAGAGNSFLLMLPNVMPHHAAALLGNLCSLACDYVARQKVGGLNFNYFTMKQMPVLAPNMYGEADLSFIVPRVLELTYTAHDLKDWARDLGYNGPPFVWDDERRFELRCELDVAFFHRYLPSDLNGDWIQAENETADQLFELKRHFPTPRAAVSYILDQFPIVRERDERRYACFRTKERILSIYDDMIKAMVKNH